MFQHSQSALLFVLLLCTKIINAQIFVKEWAEEGSYPEPGPFLADKNDFFTHAHCNKTKDQICTTYAIVTKKEIRENITYERSCQFESARKETLVKGPFGSTDHNKFILVFAVYKDDREVESQEFRRIDMSDCDSKVIWRLADDEALRDIVWYKDKFEFYAFNSIKRYKDYAMSYDYEGNVVDSYPLMLQTKITDHTRVYTLKNRSAFSKEFYLNTYRYEIVDKNVQNWFSKLVYVNINKNIEIELLEVSIDTNPFATTTKESTEYYLLGLCWTSDKSSSVNCTQFHGNGNQLMNVTTLKFAKSVRLLNVRNLRKGGMLVLTAQPGGEEKSSLCDDFRAWKVDASGNLQQSIKIVAPSMSCTLTKLVTEIAENDEGEYCFYLFYRYASVTYVSACVPAKYFA